MKRILIISYYWPPSGGSGVQRWLKFAKYLPKYGWEPVIFTPENPDFSIKDQSLTEEILDSTEVIKFPIREPYSLFRKLFGLKGKKENNAGIVSNSGNGFKNFLANFIRGNFFIPDPKIFWVKPSIKYLKKYLETNHIDCIITTGPPHSMHLIGLGLKSKFSIPWIVDFRDPWSELDMLDSYHILPFRYRKYKALEKKVLKAADLTLTVSKIWEKDFQRLGSDKTAMITNGFDSSDFNKEVIPYSNFVMAHFGLLNHLRNPKKLWMALALLCQENKEFDNKLRLHFGGTIDQAILDEIKSFPILADKVKIYPYLSHEDVIEEYKKSSLLLLLLFNSESGKGNIPGKLFEYLASNKPIISFGNRGGDSEEIVSATKENLFVEYGSNELSLKKYIEKTFIQWSESEVVPMNETTNNYSREFLTKKLVELLDKLN